MTPRQTTFERATFEYDHEFEAALTEAIATTIFETSRVTDVNAVVVRTGETARALTRTLTMVLALSPSVTRQTIDEISECAALLRRQSRAGRSTPPGIFRADLPGHGRCGKCMMHGSVSGACPTRRTRPRWPRSATPFST